MPTLLQLSLDVPSAATGTGDRLLLLEHSAHGEPRVSLELAMCAARLNHSYAIHNWQPTPQLLRLAHRGYAALQRPPGPAEAGPAMNQQSTPRPAALVGAGAWHPQRHRAAPARGARRAAHRGGARADRRPAVVRRRRVAKLAPVGAVRGARGRASRGITGGRAGGTRGHILRHTRRFTSPRVISEA